jgi:hypothetical protein
MLLMALAAEGLLPPEVAPQYLAQGLALSHDCHALCNALVPGAQHRCRDVWGHGFPYILTLKLCILQVAPRWCHSRATGTLRPTPRRSRPAPADLPAGKLQHEFNIS